MVELSLRESNQLVLGHTVRSKQIQDLNPDPLSLRQDAAETLSGVSRFTVKTENTAESGVPFPKGVLPPPFYLAWPASGVSTQP